MGLYFQRQVVLVNAIRYDGENTKEVVGWVARHGGCIYKVGDTLYLDVPEEEKQVKPGDWIVCQADGVFRVMGNRTFKRDFAPLTGERSTKRSEVIQTMRRAR